MSMRILLALLFVCSFFSNAADAQELRAGDTIHILIWQDQKLNQTVVISAAGTFEFPLAGQIKAGGLTPKAIEEELRSRLAKNYTGPLDVTVTLAAVNTGAEDKTKPGIMVTGELQRPGPYPIPTKTSVMQAIALAGGLGPYAAKQRIQIHRNISGADSILLFNYGAYESGAERANNIDLRSGDVIIVPERGLHE
jgi:polysaccharide export outer membrane protein